MWGRPALLRGSPPVGVSPDQQKGKDFCCNTRAPAGPGVGGRETLRKGLPKAPRRALYRRSPQSPGMGTQSGGTAAEIPAPGIRWCFASICA